MTGEETARLAPLLRDLLIGRARLDAPITYGDAARIVGIHARQVRPLLDIIGQDCQAADQPILTAMVVLKDSGECGAGIFRVFGVTNPRDERRRCQEYWLTHQEGPVGDLARRAIRFAAQQVRPEQAAFRNAVFLRYAGRCPLSRCTLPAVLEAAHLPGRDWRDGYNQATDGVLLRADLHRLLDRSMMILRDDGTVDFAGEAKESYRDFADASWFPSLEPST